MNLKVAIIIGWNHFRHPSALVVFNRMYSIGFWHVQIREKERKTELSGPRTAISFITFSSLCSVNFASYTSAKACTTIEPRNSCRCHSFLVYIVMRELRTGQRS
jgi:hypothetical protein